MGDTNTDTTGDKKAVKTSDTPGDSTQTVIVDGEPVTIDDQTTVQELKDLVGAPEEDIATHRDDTGLHALAEDAIVAERVADGQTMNFQPAGRKDQFG